MSSRKRADDAADGEGGAEKRQRDSLEAAASSLKCSITTNLLVDPVATADGQIYERSAIQRWFETHDTSPNTGARLDHKSLTALPAVRATIQHLVDSNSLAPAEASEWLVRKGIATADARDWVEAKRLLLRAYELGQAAAGYHLGRAWIEEAADANVPDAVQEVQRRAALNAGAPAAEQALTPIRTLSEIAPGDKVLVLSQDQIRAACEERDAISADHLLSESATIRIVDEIDGSDMTIHTTGGLWFPMAACAKLASANPVAYSSISNVAENHKVLLLGEAACRAAFAADDLEYSEDENFQPDRTLFTVQSVMRDQPRVVVECSSAEGEVDSFVVPFGAIAGRIEDV